MSVDTARYERGGWVLRLSFAGVQAFRIQRGEIHVPDVIPECRSARAVQRVFLSGLMKHVQQQNSTGGCFADVEGLGEFQPGGENARS